MSTIYVSKVGKKIYVDVPSKRYTGAFSTIAKAHAFIKPAILAGWHVEYAKDMKVKKNPIEHLPPEYVVVKDNDVIMGESDGDDLFLKAITKHKIGLVIETMKGSQGFPVVRFSGSLKNIYAFLPEWYVTWKKVSEEFASNYDAKRYKADWKKTKGSIAKLKKESLRIRKHIAKKEK